MSKLIKRIAQLNAIIDRKILEGKPYVKEAREHANLYYFIRNNK